MPKDLTGEREQPYVPGGACTILPERSGSTGVGKPRLGDGDALLAGAGRDDVPFAVADGMGTTRRGR